MKLLDHFKRTFSPEEIQNGVKKAQELAKQWQDKEHLKLAFKCIDLTSLNSTDNHKQITEMTKKVSEFEKNFDEIPNVAAICVYPVFVPTVKKNLCTDNVQIASVAGGFPSSQTFLEIKTQETRLCVQRGANEIDMVISIGEFLDKDYALTYHEVRKIRKAAGDAHLKVILESGVLDKPENIYNASVLSMHAGADFIKTSTGKEKVGATLEAAYVMAYAIKDFYEETGEKIGFKPAGGISSPQNALEYMAVIYNILGEEWLNNKLFRIGTSSLANKLLSEIVGSETKYF